MQTLVLTNLKTIDQGIEVKLRVNKANVYIPFKHIYYSSLYQQPFSNSPSFLSTGYIA